MPVLTICNHKGGTGKTTSSIHLAAALGHRGQRVLVVDFDPQGFLTRMLGCQEPPPEHSALGLLNAEADLRTFPVQSVSGFDLIGSTMALTKSLRHLTKPTDVLWLRETVGAGHDYDVILLDTAAALSVYTMNALVASDLVVIPVTPEYQPVVGAEQTWQTCGLVQSKLNPRMETPRFLLTQVDARLNRHARYSAYLREKYGEAVLETPIRTSSSLAVASRDGRTVFDNRTTTRGAEDYSSAAAEIESLIFRSEAPASEEEERPATPTASDRPAVSHTTAPPPAAPPPAPQPVSTPAEQGPEADPFAQPLVFSLQADPALRQPLADEEPEAPRAPEPPEPVSESPSPPAVEPVPQTRPEPVEEPALEPAQEPAPAPAPLWTRLWRG